MKVDIKLNGVKLTKDIPGSWYEVTFGQMLKMMACKSDLAECVSIFTGIDVDTLNKANIGNLQTVITLLSFRLTPLPQYLLPKTVMGYDVKNLEIENIARYADLEGIIKPFMGQEGAENEILTKYPLMVATYAVEPYSYQRAEALADYFLDAPAMEVLAVGNFTLVNMLGLRNITPTIVPQGASMRRRLRQALRNFTFDLVSTLRYYSWRSRQNKAVRNYLNGV